MIFLEVVPNTYGTPNLFIISKLTYVVPKVPKQFLSFETGRPISRPLLGWATYGTSKKFTSGTKRISTWLKQDEPPSKLVQR